MARLGRGSRVVVTQPIRRGSGDPRGQVKVRRGAKARVVERHVRRRYGRLLPLRRFRKVTYDLDVDDGLRALFVPAVSGSSLRRAPLVPLRRLLVVAILALVAFQVVLQRLV
jgi:hypothetical protein